MVTKADDDKPTSETVLDNAIETLHIGERAINAEIQKIAAGKAKKNGHDPGSRIAFLTAKVGSIADSLRKIEAARQKRVDELSKALVLAWLRELDVTERARFLREAQQIDSKRSGLA